MSTDDIKPFPAPWKLKGTVFLFPFWTNKDQIAQADAAGITYSPLEAKGGYASHEGNEHLGGLGMIQIIRYSESPVGPYDELILIPGFWEYVVEENGKRAKKRNTRITRIYVSQKYTCWNGRKNWNIPKHLASFDFKDNADGSTNVKVFPHDTTGDVAETTASSTPLFQANFKPIRYLPSFPTSTNLLKYVGVDATLVQPPLPAGNGSQCELPGTDQWCAIVPGQSARKTTVGWFDSRQGEDGKETEGQFENFWPESRRWHIGVKMEDAEIDFPNGKHWESPKSVL